MNPLTVYTSKFRALLVAEGTPRIGLTAIDSADVRHFVRGIRLMCEDVKVIKCGDELIIEKAQGLL